MRYYQLYRQANKGIIQIFGDITDDAYCGVSAESFSQDLEQLGDVEEIEVYINSYGGSVAQGFAIYNMLKNHPAKVTTICNGFACSIASVIFLAGEERIMQGASLLMIHNPFCMSCGNAEELRKTADDLDKMAQVSIDLYSEVTGLDSDTIKAMMDKETWMSAKEAIDLGFATGTTKDEDIQLLSIVQSIKTSLVDTILNTQKMAPVTEESQQTLEEPQKIEDAQIKAEEPSKTLQNFLKIFN